MDEEGSELLPQGLWTTSGRLAITKDSNEEQKVNENTL